MFSTSGFPGRPSGPLGGHDKYLGGFLKKKFGKPCYTYLAANDT